VRTKVYLNIYRKIITYNYNILFILGSASDGTRSSQQLISDLRKILYREEDYKEQPLGRCDKVDLSSVSLKRTLNLWLERAVASLPIYPLYYRNHTV